MSKYYILTHFHYLFNNEFNTRKILHTFEDDNWGKHEYEAQKYTFNSIYGTEYTNRKLTELRNTKALLVLTEDKEGKIELYKFWANNGTHTFYNCYNQIHLYSGWYPNANKTVQPFLEKNIA